MRLFKVAAVCGLIVTGCTTQIQHGLDERDANEIVSVLSARGFEVEKVREPGKHPTWAIAVESGERERAVSTLAELKLPRPSRPTTRTIFNGGGLIDSPAAERLRALEAQEGDIEEQLENLSGVSSASVELVVPTPPRAGEFASPSKASVLLKVRRDAIERIGRSRTDIQALVAGAVDGLSPREVVLVVDEVQGERVAPVHDDMARRWPLVAGAGLLVATATLAGFLMLRTRGSSTQAPVTPVAIAASRPVINPAVQRRAS